MAPTFETIEPHINEIRDYIFGDLGRITNLDLGVNYMAAGIMMCACDLFAYLRYGRLYRGADFVTDYMGQIDSRYSKIGRTLYKSLRHGIVHTYETEKVQIGNKTIDFCISWRTREHFSVDRSKLEINLNIRKMLEELRAAFEMYVEELRINGERRDQFLKIRHKILKGTNRNKKEEQALLNFFK
jgi:hypothetical protein